MTSLLVLSLLFYLAKLIFPAENDQGVPDFGAPSEYV
jgi:hypothetical protein